MAGEFKVVCKQSGVIPLLEDKIVLITARKSDRWIIPKGYIEKGFSAADSAAKEAFEEAGIIGTLQYQPAGEFVYRKFDKYFNVVVYPLYVDKMLDVWDEMHERQRKLVTPQEAVQMVYHKELSELITSFFAVPVKVR